MALLPQDNFLRTDRVMNSRDIRTKIAIAVSEFKTDTGYLPIRLQVSREHLNELEYSTFEFPAGHTLSIDYVEGMSPGEVRCVGPEVINNSSD
jgi:hypothetical protein